MLHSPRPPHHPFKPVHRHIDYHDPNRPAKSATLTYLSVYDTEYHLPVSPSV
jgi:hypothetical protein